jgi:hypothetical protein
MQPGWRREKKRATSRLRALASFFSRRQAPRIYNSAYHKLKLGIAEVTVALLTQGQNLPMITL